MTSPSLAIYARVSTGRQAESLEGQLVRLRSRAPGAAEFSDLLSGRGVDRPEFDRLARAVRDGMVDEVYVSRLDRLGRSARGILGFFELAEAHGTRVVVVDQAIDTSTPVGRMVRTVLAAMAELEADLIGERTKDAMRAFKDGTRRTRSGNPVGRPRVVDGTLIRKIHELRDVPERPTWNELARILHHPSGSLRKWYSASLGGTPSVINQPPRFPPPSTAP
ncbi:MAG: recombinase family protein [Thermoplasmata archaeon]|nr:recombinase family protein [Thermoplasmata archaeon]